MKKKHQPGRPPKYGESQTARLYLRTLVEDKLLFEAAAESAEMSLSDWIRDRLKEAADRELSGEGQIKKASNASKRAIPKT